ncbi:glutamine-rich protein 2 isoform X3 [Lissotriton helveticus]
MPSKVSLFDLANLSIGTPEVGAVNFNALHTLLHAIIRQLNIQDVQADISEEDSKAPTAVPSKAALPLPGKEAPSPKVASVYHQLEKKVKKIEKQMEVLNHLPTGTELLERSKTSEAPAANPVGDMWQMMQMKKKIETNEDGINKIMALLQDLLNETNGVKGDIQKVNEQFGETQQKKMQQEAETVQQAIRDMEEKLKQLPGPEEMKKMVEWEVLHETLVKSRTGSPTSVVSGQGIQTGSGAASGTQGHAPGTQAHAPGTAGTAPGTAGAAPGTAGTAPGTAGTAPGTAGTAPGTAPGTAGTAPGTAGTATGTAGTAPGTAGAAQGTAGTAPGTASTAQGTAGTAPGTLAPGNAGTAPGAPGSAPGAPGAAPGTQQATGADPAHRSEHTSASDHGSPRGTEQGHSPAEGSRSDASLSRANSISERYNDTVEALRNLGGLSDQTALLKQLIDALDQKKADRSELKHMKQITDMAKDRLSKLPDDLDKRLATFEKNLEETHEDRQKEGELINRIQSTIHQLQEECEKLNATTGSLIEDHQQKQRHIDILYQSLEKLEDKKADKDILEMDLDVKADKRALEGKVSRTQFDATNEQLYRIMQELLEKVTVQEQDWQNVVDKISSEMESKLDRLELDPFKRQLEERWKAIRKQLKDRSPHYDADEAAGIRKQLIARFHCISCDRPVDMAVPGPPVMTVPSMPALPCHRTNRPYTVYELEQVRQQTKSMKSGLYHTRYEAAQLEKSVNQLRRIHSRMRMEIEKVQLHFGGSVRASTQAIREMLQARCISLGQYRRRYESKLSVERMPEMSDYSITATPRSCGGSHTLTFPHRRYTRLQNIGSNQCVQPEEENILALLKQEEVDILGLDGHIYRGRMENRFPAIPVKEASKIRGKSSQSATKMDANSATERPRSAKSSSSTHALSRPLKDRPVSSLGRLSQSSLVPQPAPTPQPEEPKEEPKEEPPAPPTPQARESLEVRVDASFKKLPEEEDAS